MLIDFLLFAFGTVLVIKGGDWFVDASTMIAERSGLPKVLIGATIVSLATAMPELLVSVFAVLQGATDLGLGNNIGSVICNTALITSITLIFSKPVKAGFAFVRKGVFMLFCMVVLFAMASDMHLEIRDGILLLIVFACFYWLNIREARVTMGRRKDHNPDKSVSIPKAAFLFAIGAIALVSGARLMVDHGIMIAEWLGISSRVIGLTIVALGTSLPELVTALKALARKEYGLTVGNIVGANIINLTLIPGLSAVLAKGEYAFNDQSNLLLFDLPVAMVALCMFIVPAIATRGRLSRYQGVMMLLFYIAYTVSLVV